MEISLRAGALADSVKGRVRAAQGHPPRGRLLVGQGQKTRPQRRSRAGSHHGEETEIGAALIALVGQNKNIESHHGNIRDIP
jgi:hypothetical protein